MQLKSSKTSVKSADKKLCECNREIKEGMNWCLDEIKAEKTYFL
jgi:hypothetical protein